MKCPGRLGGGIEPAEVRTVGDDRYLGRWRPELDEAVGERVVDGQDGRREGDRGSFLGAQRAVPGPARGTREAEPEELRHRLVEIEDDRRPDEPQRQGGEDEGVGQAVDLDDRVAPPAMGAQERPAARTKNAPYSPRYVPMPAPWWRWTSRRTTRTPSIDASGASSGRRSEKTSTGRPAATSASASRRTRGSSS